MNTEPSFLETHNNLRANIHQVPEGYFDQLPTYVQRHVATHPSLRRRSVKFIVLHYAMPYVTACLLLVGGSYFLFFKNNGKQTTNHSNTSTQEISLNLTKEEALEYLNQNLDASHESIVTDQIQTAANVGNEPKIQSGPITDTLPTVNN